MDRPSTCTHMAYSGLYSGIIYSRNRPALKLQVGGPPAVRLIQLPSMLLHRHPHSSRRFIVTIICTVITLFHRVEGFPVMAEKAGVGSPPLPILLHSDASHSAAVSTLVTRSYDAVHDSVFIPTIVTMGVLVIICIFCSYNLIAHRDPVDSRGTYNEGPIFSSQYALGRVESDHGSRPLSKISKATRGSVPSASASMPGTPSVNSNMLDRLQRRREEEHRRLLQQQDPYEQYMSANQGYPYPQQHYQYTPHPSEPGSAVHHGEGVQPQLPLSAHVPTAQPPLMNVNPSRERHWAQQEERQSLQQSDPRRGISQSPSAQTSSTGTRVNSDVLSYQTPPEARRHPLPNNPPRLENQDYFSPQHPAGGIPQPSTHGNISVPANHTPPLPSTSNSPQAAHVHGFTNQPPGYSANSLKR